MINRNAVDEENSLAVNLLSAVLRSAEIKKPLQEIAEVFINKILNPLKIRLAQIKQIADLPLQQQSLLQNMAASLTAEKRQYGALLPNIKSSKDIMSSVANIEKMLDAQIQILANINQIKSLDDLSVMIKIMIEVAYFHYEGMVFTPQKDFSLMVSLIFPSVEETDIRIFRHELNQPAMLALTHGIGNKSADLGPSSAEQGYIAGKAIFYTISMHTRISLICQDYDRTRSPASANKMNYYKIPLDKTSRKPLESYAHQWRTCFEKYAYDSKNQSALPLIASISGSVARIFITLQFFDAFTQNNGAFDFEKAQILANCLMGFMIYAGHHSMVEVAEVYNRLLDYIALDQLEKTGPTPAMTEEKMPYFRVGNYASFFHRSFAQVIKSHVEPRQELRNCPL